jgi:hypothetical protein
MLRIAGGIILALAILVLFAAIAKPIFKLLAYLIGLYVLIMAAGFLLWGLMDVYEYLAPMGGYGVLIAAIGILALIVVTRSVFLSARNRGYRKTNQNSVDAPPMRPYTAAAGGLKRDKSNKALH